MLGPRGAQRILLAALIAAAVGVTPHGAPRAQTAPLPDSARLDAVFAGYTDRTPGCAAAVVRDGATIYARGFGLADLSHRITIGPDTVFEIGSISKQFTALAVLLLEADGKLRLDDSVQQHLPETARLLPQRVTLRQLLHHTGGLVGYQELLELAGVAKENVIGAPDVMRVLAVLPQLNSVPGSRYSYSDTGYFLLAQVVARVNGGSLNAFLQARVFGPLGMTSTYVFNDHRRVVPRRARAYAPGAESQTWLLDESNWVMDGDASVHSTVIDLARWAAEVTRPRVLPPQLIEQMRTPGRLDDGMAVPYGAGQIPNTYRGLPRALHDGGWVGYRSFMTHFPAQDTSVAVLCNRADAPAGQFAHRLVDEVLAHALAPVPQPNAADPAQAVLAAERLAGLYLHEDGFQLARITGNASGSLGARLGTRNATFRAADAGVWRSAGGTLQLRPSDDGRVLRVDEAGRTTESYRRLPPFTPSAADTDALAGTFRHAALASTLSITRAANGLTARFHGPGGAVEALEWIGPDHLAGTGFVLRLERDAQRRVTGLQYMNERVRGLRYLRESRPPTGGDQ